MSHWKCKCFRHSSFRQIAALSLHQLTLHICWTDHFFLLFNSPYASLKLQVFFFANFVLICGLANCCTYAVNFDIAHSLNRLFLLAIYCTCAVSINFAQLLNKPFLIPQTFTPWNTFFWGAGAFLKLSS